MKFFDLFSKFKKTAELKSYITFLRTPYAISGRKMIGVNFGTLCHIFTLSRSPYRESLVIHFLFDLLFLNILMIFVHCNLDGSLSRRAPPYLRENFDLLLDRFDTSPTPFLLAFKLKSVHSSSNRCLLSWLAK